MVFELTLVVIGTDSIGSCKSNYHTITPTTDPYVFIVTTKNRSVTEQTRNGSLHMNGPTGDEWSVSKRDQ